MPGGPKAGDRKGAALIKTADSAFLAMRDSTTFSTEFYGIGPPATACGSTPTTHRVSVTAYGDSSNTAPTRYTSCSDSKGRQL
jgi:hypothetical protein